MALVSDDLIPYALILFSNLRWPGQDKRRKLLHPVDQVHLLSRVDYLHFFNVESIKDLVPIQVSEHAGELGGDPSTLSVGGDSAGGNLAGAIALKARDEQAQGAPKIRFQLLTCPVCPAPSLAMPCYYQYVIGKIHDPSAGLIRAPSQSICSSHTQPLL